MTDAQVRAIKANLSNAEKSGDVKQMCAALCVGLIENAECAAHSGERVKNIETMTSDIKRVLETMTAAIARRASDGDEMESRIKSLEDWRVKIEERARGAGYMAKALYIVGGGAGGVLAVTLPNIIKAIGDVYAR